jgi:hypothetical protein
MIAVGDADTLGPWTAHIEAMDQAVAANDMGGSVRAWRQAYSAALTSPGWLGLFTVATASLRVGTFPNLARRATALARETYWIAFFRARQRRSFTGALLTAEAFATLGDRDAAERCLGVAAQLASGDGDLVEVDRVRIIVDRLAHGRTTQQEATEERATAL